MTEIKTAAPPPHEHRAKPAQWEPLMPPKSAAALFFKSLRNVSPWTLAGFGFFAVALLILLLTYGSPAGATLGYSFVSIILEALPFVMLGSLLGGLFEVFVPRDWVVRLLPERKITAILFAAALGLLLPVCECAVIPFTRRLVRKGVPFATAVAYLLAGPIVNLLVGSATLMAYAWNWHILAARMVFGYVVAVSVALVMDRFYPDQTALSDPSMAGAIACGSGCGCSDDQEHDQDPVHAHANAVPLLPRLAEAINHAGDDFLLVGQFLVLGAFVAAICQTLLPRHTLLLMTHAPALAIALMMGLAVVLNLCSGADAFVAASFRSVLPISAQMGFMVLGPMLDLKLSAMYLSFMKKRAFIMLVVLMYSFVFLLMVAWHYLFVGAAN